MKTTLYIKNMVCNRCIKVVEEELMKLRFQLTTGELTDHNQIRFVRRQIARLLTIVRKREIELEMESES